jgi:hypothetical protein
MAMPSIPIAAVAAIPVTLVMVSQTVQGTAQSLDAVGIDGEEARRRISLMASATGVALVVAALAMSAHQHNYAPAVVTAITAGVVVYGFRRITL